MILTAGSVLAWAWSALPPTLTRGPYLQSTTSTGITVVFRTSTADTSTLRYGTHLGGPWEFETSDASSTQHVYQLTGLRPETRYYYEIASGGAVLANGPGTFFETTPPQNSRAPIRFVAFGDSGTGSSGQLRVASRMEAINPQPQLALGLGDLVYDSGAAGDYDPKLFRPYTNLFRRLTFWPTMGNHDFKTSSGQPYKDAFYLPTTTGAPGKPSNTELYYSFDQGMAHFVCLDSESSSTSPGSAMYTWLSNDLDDARARGKRWLFVFMHHPPYSAGTHESESEGDLVDIHDNLVPLFDAKKVDMVLVGHSHNYERSFLAKNSVVMQNSPNDYNKITSPDGVIYIVSGCAGQTGSGPLDLPIMSKSLGDVLGFNVVDVTWNELRGSFVEDDGRTTDMFTIHKATDTAAPKVTSVRATGSNAVEVVFDEPVRAGNSGTGAENLAHYSLDRGAVTSAALQTDQCTVKLGTTALPSQRGITVFVQGVADTTGNVNNTGEPEYFVLAGTAAGAPTAVIHSDAWTANNPSKITFFANRSKDPDGQPLVYFWDFGDGVRGRGLAIQEHTFVADGTYDVYLMTRDAQKLDALEKHTVRIHSQGNAPVARLSANQTQVAVGGRIDFNSSGSADPDGGALVIHWDFGEPAKGPANESIQPSVSKVFTTKGRFLVTLAVTDDEGSTSTQRMFVTVN